MIRSAHVVQDELDEVLAAMDAILADNPDLFTSAPNAEQEERYKRLLHRAGKLEAELNYDTR